MGRKRKTASIGDTPLCKNLAWILKHPDSGHPYRHGLKGFKQELENINQVIKTKYPDKKRGKMVPNAIEMIISGQRDPELKSIRKIAEAIETIFDIKIDPFDLFVDKNKWINISELNPKHREIYDKLKKIRNEMTLIAIESLIDLGLSKEEEVIENDKSNDVNSNEMKNQKNG